VSDYEADYQTAIDLFSRLVDEKDDPAAKANLAVMYASGRGVGADMDEAFRLTSEAADAKVDFAMYNLGVLYENGWGVQSDSEKAEELFKNAEELLANGSNRYFWTQIRFLTSVTEGFIYSSRNGEFYFGYPRYS